MLDFQLKTALEDKLQGMLDRIAGLEDAIAQELTDWQVDDMNRKYPKTDQTTGAASTVIYPRSRTNTPRRRAIVRKRGSGSGRIVGRKRPILRAVLVQLLQERMRALGEKTLKWQ